VGMGEDVDFLEDLLRKTNLPFNNDLGYHDDGEDSALEFGSGYGDAPAYLGSESRTGGTGTPLDFFPWDGFAAFELSQSISAAISPSASASDLLNSTSLFPMSMNLDMNFDGLNAPTVDLEESLRLALEANRKYQGELRLSLASVDHAAALNRQHAQQLGLLKKRISAVTRPANQKMASSNFSNFTPTSQFKPEAFGIPQETLLALIPEKDRQAYEAMQTYTTLAKQSSKWTSREILMLREGVKVAVKKRMLNAVLSENPTSNVQERVRQIQEISDAELLGGSPDEVDWDFVSQAHLHASRSPTDCRLQWCTQQHPSLNMSDVWSEEERARLGQLVAEYGRAGRWVEIAAALGTGRPPWLCLSFYQKHIRTDLLKGRWSSDEDARLLALVADNRDCESGEINWPRIVNQMRDRTTTQCIHRFYKALDPSIKRGRWTPDEDELLRLGVSIHDRDWYLVRNWVPGRTDMQCRERWMNVLAPELKQDAFSAEEDARLLQLVEEAGGPGQWASLQSKHFPERTDNQLRRRYLQLTTATPSTKPTPRTTAGPTPRRRESSSGPLLPVGPKKRGRKPKAQDPAAPPKPLPPRVAKRIGPDFQRRQSKRVRE